MKKTLTVFILTVVALLGAGIVVMASASTKLALESPRYHGDLYYFLKRQAIWLGVALVCGCLVCLFDYHHWKKFQLLKKYPLLPILFYVFVVALLVLTLCPGLKQKINGSYRWLVLGPFSIQPGEFAKLAIIVTTAIWMDYIKRRPTLAVAVAAVTTRGMRVKKRLMEFVQEIAVPGMLLGIFAFLMYKEKDLGALMVVCVLGLSLMFVAGIRKVYLFSFGGVAAVLASCWVWLDAPRLKRITAWWNFLFDPDGVKVTADNYQLIQSTIAFKMGGLGGVGFNQSTQKQFYLPEAHTDFVAAIGGEELGFFFSVGIVIAYAVLLICGILISLHAPDRLGRLLAFGMVFLLVFQGAFNIGVVTGVFPTKGIALPFISYGGSNLITALVAVGTLFNIGTQVDSDNERMYTRVVRNAARAG